jgi:hypothetical protein
MDIVLDSNIFCADYKLEGSAFRVFFGGLPRVHARLVVPEIVIDEVVNKYRERILELNGDLRRVAHEAARLLGRELVTMLDKEVVDEEVSKYEHYLREQLGKAGATILPYPKTKHQELVRRALDRRRPFKSNDAGYRDALIWSGILAHLREAKKVLAFVTANSRDFSEGSNLHTDLLRDIEQLHVSGAGVRLYADLSSLNQALILPELERLDGVLQKLQDNTLSGFSLHEWVHGALVHDVEDLAYAFGPLQGDHGYTSVEGIEFDEIDVYDVRSVGTDQIFISAHAAGSGILSVTASPSDFIHDDVREFFEVPGDGDVNADVPTRLDVRFSLVLDSKTLKVLSAEVSRIDSDFSTVEFNVGRNT